tara:strand:+ start:327 stop:911 length:585 start_codon:yes stop_codon:yes gene_type:complete
MALASKKYEKFYETTGTGKDKIDSTRLTTAESAWADEKSKGCADYMADPILSPLVYQLQQMQDELDELRTEISDNKDKTAFPGFGTSSTTALAGDTSLLALGTSSTTALAGDTTTISTSQASAITANTAKTGISTSQASEITANTAKVSQGLNTANTTMQFDVTEVKGNYYLTITVVAGTGKAAVTKTVTLTLS